MNYLTEIRLFNEWLETSEMTTSGIALWYALMHIANRSGWKPELCIPVSALCLRTKLSRSAIYKERSVLRNHGLIDFDVGDGRQSSTYKIVGFEQRFMSTLASATATQQKTQTDEDEVEGFTIVSTTKTQPATQTEFVSTQQTQRCTIYKQKDISLDLYQEIKKRGYRRKKKEAADFDLSFIGDGVWEALVESWLEYKRSRSENYKSDISVKKFHTMLRNLSRGDPTTARQIIDKSIANNWAGIFELQDDGKSRSQTSQPVRPAIGQRIGQIKQPEDEARRQQLLEKFDRKK